LLREATFLQAVLLHAFMGAKRSVPYVQPLICSCPYRVIVTVQLHLVRPSTNQPMQAPGCINARKVRRSFVRTTGTALAPIHASYCTDQAGLLVLHQPPYTRAAVLISGRTAFAVLSPVHASCCSDQAGPYLTASTPVHESRCPDQVGMLHGNQLSLRTCP
jgi:hypothetical protein